MHWINVKWIYLREIRDQLRDRRTLFTIFVLPLLLYPLLGMAFLQIAQFRREHPTSVLILGDTKLPDHPRLIRVRQPADKFDTFAEPFCSVEEQRLLQLTIQLHPAPTTPEQLREFADRTIQSQAYDAVVYFPPNFTDQLARFRESLDNNGGLAEQTAKLGILEPAIFANAANDKSRMARDRVEQVLYRWRESIVQENLKLRHVPPAATEPFQVVSNDVSRERSRRAALWSKILPFVVLVWSLTGAFYPAVDLCAGEKERGTLETLLCSPAQRVEIVWGKLLTIMTFSMGTSLLNLISISLTGTFVMGQVQQLAGPDAQLSLGSPPLSAMAWLVVALVPLSALFSALSLAIAAFARSSKEGQYYLMPLLFLTLPLMMLPMLPNSELDLGTSFIPVTGVMLLLQSLIEAKYTEALRFAAPVAAVTAIGCWLAIRWAVDQFNNEAVLFRESERFGLGLWLRRLVRDRGETPSVGEAVFCGVLLLVIRFFTSFVVDMPTTWNGFARTTAVSLMAFFAFPALLMTIVLTRSPRKTLLLNLPTPAALAMAIGLAFTIHPAGVAIGQAISHLYPISPDAEVQIRALTGIFKMAPSIFSIMLVLALVPAICEELAFRGFILSGLRHSGHKWAAIIGSAAFFGAAHGILQQSLAAAILGVVIGYIAVQSGSLLCTIAFHLLYNSLTFLTQLVFVERLNSLAPLGWIFKPVEGGLEYRWPVLLLGTLASAAILLWFRRLPFEATREETIQQAIDHEWVQVKA